MSQQDTESQADAVSPGAEFGGAGLRSGRPRSRSVASSTLSREMHCRAWCSVVAKVLAARKRQVHSSASGIVSEHDRDCGAADVQLGDRVGDHGGRTWLSLNSCEYWPPTTTATGARRRRRRPGGLLPLVTTYGEDLSGIVKLLTLFGGCEDWSWRLRRGKRATGIRSRSSGTLCGCITVSRRACATLSS